MFYLNNFTAIRPAMQSALSIFFPYLEFDDTILFLIQRIRKRRGVSQYAYMWPQGIVPYEYDSTFSK